MTPSTEAHCYLASWERSLPFTGGLALEAELRQAKLLDYSVASLDGIDVFLRRIHTEFAPLSSSAQALDHLAHFLTFYIGEVVARANRVPVQWEYLVQRATPAETPENRLENCLEEPTLACVVPVPGSNEGQPFWPMFVVKRLLMTGSGESVRQCVGLMIHRPTDKNQERAPLEPLPPSYLPIDTDLANRSWTSEQVTALNISPPAWLASDPMQKVLDAEAVLMKEGRVVWGAYVQANSVLFQQVWHGGSVAEVLYDPLGRIVAPDLERLASTVFQLKAASKLKHDQVTVAEHLRSEVQRAFGMPIPASICSPALSLSTIYIDQMHVPDGSLAMRSFPILIHPKHPGVIKLLPWPLWPEALTTTWMALSSQKYGKAIAVKRLKEDALQPTPDAQSTFDLAMSIYQGDTTNAPNHVRALGLLKANAQRGHTFSMVWIGHLHLFGHGVEKNPRQALRWYLTAATAGNDVATVLVAENYLHADGIEPNVRKGKEWLKNAHAAGNPVARDLLLRFEREELTLKGFLIRLWARIDRG